MTLGTTAAALALLFGAGPLSAQHAPSAAPSELRGAAHGNDTLRFDGREGQLDVRIPRFDRPDVNIDARFEEAEWEQAALLTGFTQYTPSEGVPASQETEVRVFYTEDAIYFAIRAHDSQPDEILALLSERDRSSFGSDWVRLMIDTFDDRRQAYTFFVNPHGIQTDGLWQESLQPLGGPTGPKVDFNPDYIWDSQGRVLDDGWVAEIRIPFVSIRFPDSDVQNWGLQIARGVTRNDFKSSWAPLTQEVTNVLSQGGRLIGLEGLRPKRLVEFNPVVTGKIDGARVDGAFDRESPEPEFGLNARFGITPNLVFDATANPDFSQVEADVDQIQVNERFALFFPEKRPFFLNGSEVFGSTQRLVHTRSIVDPIGGAKLTGKIGEVGLAYLGALDESPSSVFGGDGRAVFNLVRARQDVGTASTVGLLFTDRTLTEGGGYNRVVSGDARAVFGGRYTLETQVTGSWTSFGSGDSGLKPAVSAVFRRAGRNFFYSAKFEDIHPEFRASSGFIPRVGDVEAQASVGYNWYPAPGGELERVGLELKSNNFFDHDGFYDGAGPYEWEVEAWPSLTFRGRRSVFAILRLGGFQIRPEDYDAYEVLGANGDAEPLPPLPDLQNMWGFAAFPNIRVNEKVQLNGQLFYRVVPIFAEAARGFEIRTSPSVQLSPSDAWRIDLSHTWARLWRRSDDSEFSTVNLSRARVQYQFGRSVFVRVIGQYDLEDRDALQHPVTGQPLLIGGVLQEARERGNFQTQALVSYEPSPGTVFFLGYSRLMDGPYGYRLQDKNTLRDGVFAKVSYLLRR